MAKLVRRRFIIDIVEVTPPPLETQEPPPLATRETGRQSWYETPEERRQRLRRKPAAPAPSPEPKPTTDGENH